VLVSGLNDLSVSGYRPAGIAKQIGQRLRQQLIDGRADIPADAALNLLEKLIEVPVAHDPERFLEITLLGARQAGSATKPAPPPAKSDEPDRSEPVEAAPEEPEESARQQESGPEKPEPGATGDAVFDESLWPEVLQTLKRNHNTLYGVVRMAQPEFNGDTLKLSFAFAFHQKRINESSNRQKLADVIHGLTGRKVKVECELDPSAKPPESSVDMAETPSDADLNAISNIFGAAEVLES
jgi:DNA polymerase III subunit tau-like protein